MSSKVSIQSYVALDRRIMRMSQRAGSADPATFPFKPANWAAFLAFRILWNTEFQQMKLADSGRQGASDQVVTASARLLMFCSHYFQVLFFAIQRGEIPISVLALYSLDGLKLPDMDTEDKLLQVAANIATGDAARIAAGGVAMTNPTAAQVATALTTYNNLQSGQSVSKEAFMKERKDVADIFLDGVTVMNRLYTDIEYNYSEESIGYIHDILREWGVEFYNGPGEQTILTVTIAAGATQAVEGANLADGMTVTATILTNGGSLTMCKNLLGCETNGIGVDFGSPVTIAAGTLPGEDDQLVFTNLSAVAVEVEVKVVG